MKSRRSGQPAPVALVALAVLLGPLLFVAAGCAPNDPSLPFLQSQPENNLIYPGAALVSTTTHGPEFPMNSCCDIDRDFTSGATAQQIGDWYSAQLSRSEWSSGYTAHQNGDGTLSYYWQKPALTLNLDISPAANGTSYSVSLHSQSGLYKFVATWDSLRHAPEAGLAPPGATPSGGQGFPNNSSATVGLTQDYMLDSPIADVAAFYDSALRARGWTPVAVSSMDNAHVIAKWAKWPIVAELETNSNSYKNAYTFSLWESLDAAGSPVPLASELVPNPGDSIPDLPSAR